MRKFYFLLFSLLVAKSGFASVYPLSYFETNDVVIGENDIVNSVGGLPIYVKNQDTVIRNYGKINGDIDSDLGHMYNITIQNSGIINGTVFNRSHLIQVMNQDEDLTHLNVVNIGAADFIIHVEDFDGVDLRELKNLDASQFMFENSIIVIDDFQDWESWNKNVSFVGNHNKLYINNSYTVKSGVLIKHTDALTNIYVVFQDSDNLHKASLTKTMDGTILNVVRETNYEKVFKDKRGTLLQNLAIKNPNSKFIHKMNSANNMQELKSVMNSSYNFNHKILLEPLHILNKFHRTNLYNNDNVEGIGVIPVYIGGDKLSAFGGRAYVATKYEDIYFNLGASFTKFNYKDDINDFDGFVFGGDLQVKTNIKEQYWLRALSGFDIVKYMADYIYVEDDIKHKPNGYSLYLMSDFGYDFKLDEDVILSPFVGFNIQNSGVYKENETDTNLRTGCDIEYAFVFDDIKYLYGATVGIATNGDLFGNIKMGFDLLQDKAGIALNIDAFDNDDYGLHYKISADIKAIF